MVKLIRQAISNAIDSPAPADLGRAQEEREQQRA